MYVNGFCACTPKSSLLLGLLHTLRNRRAVFISLGSINFTARKHRVYRDNSYEIDLCQYFPKKLPHVDVAGPSRRRRAGRWQSGAARPSADLSTATTAPEAKSSGSTAMPVSWRTSLRALSVRRRHRITERTEHASTSVCVSRRHQQQQQLVWSCGRCARRGGVVVYVCQAHRRLSSCPAVSPRPRGD